MQKDEHIPEEPVQNTQAIYATEIYLLEQDLEPKKNVVRQILQALRGLEDWASKQSCQLPVPLA